jgi:hypothetical protein
MVNGWTTKAYNKSSKSFRDIYLTCLCLGFVTGCSTLSQEECLVADWQLIGREDGASGQDVSYIGNHRKACAEYGIVPDLDEYQHGYEDGLVSFCTEHNGFNQGRNGVRYNGVCPAHLESDFLAGFREGHGIYLLESKIRSANSTVNKNKKAMEELGKEILEVEKQLVSDITTSEQRLALLQDLKVKQKEHSSKEAEIRNLEIEAAKLEGVLAGMGY